MTKNTEFLKNAIMGKSVGAIARSSKYVVKNILKNIKGISLEKIVEYGQGDGVLTLELLEVLSPKGRMLVVELDHNFVKLLREISDPRLVIIEGQMQDIASDLEKYGFNNVDLVLSSIPFSLIDKKERDIVVKSTADSLKSNGKFIIFHQYSRIMVKSLKKHFKRVDVTFEPRNIFPCFVMSAEKL